jgi:hypothetical protein
VASALAPAAGAGAAVRAQSSLDLRARFAALVALAALPVSPDAAAAIAVAVAGAAAAVGDVAHDRTGIAADLLAELPGAGIAGFERNQPSTLFSQLTCMVGSTPSSIGIGAGAPVVMPLTIASCRGSFASSFFCLTGSSSSGFSTMLNEAGIGSP